MPDQSATRFSFLRERAVRILAQRGLCSHVLWQGVTLLGTRTTRRRADAATLAATAASYTLSVMVPAAELGKVSTLPRPLRDRVTVDGTRYLVLATERDVADNLRIHLGEEYA